MQQPWLDLGPALTPAEAQAVQDGPEAVAWVVLLVPGRDGMVARAHTFGRDGGRYLPGHVAANGLDELRAVLPRGLFLDTAWSPGSPPGCLGWFM